MHYGETKKFANKLFGVDPNTGRVLEPMTLSEDLGFDLEHTRIVTVRASLFVIKFGEIVDGYELTKLSSRKPVASKLPSLRRDVSRFALANFHNQKIVLTGGVC